MRRDSLAFLLHLSQHGEVCGFDLRPIPLILFTKVEQVRSILVEHASDFSMGRLIHRAFGAIDSSSPKASTTQVKPAATYPDGLTSREVEVLRLLARGLSDAQIAEQLVISPRTVNSHLTSIYSKIQVSSRVAATRYAMEHQLV